MNKLLLSSGGILLGVSLLLSGCGGGGSSNPSPASSQPATSPASSAGASVSSGVSSSSPVLSSSSLDSSSQRFSSSQVSSSSSSFPALTELTIRGTVVSNALAGSEVSFSLGGETHRTVVDDQQQYEITFDILPATSSLPFTAIASGIEGNAWIQLTALYPSLNELAKLSGSDGILDFNEFAGVNISPMTTAEYSLVIGANRPVATDAERAYALLTINADEQLNRALLIAQSIDNGYDQLPEKYNSLLEMIVDDEYLHPQTNIQQANKLTDEVDVIINDPLQAKITSEVISGKFLVRSENFTYLLDLRSDGTGNIQTSNTPGMFVWPSVASNKHATFTWVRTGSVIDVTFDEPIVFSKVSTFNNILRINCENFLNREPLCDANLYSISLSLFAENDVSKFANIDMDINLVTNSGFVMSVTVGGPYRATLYDVAKMAKMTREQLIGREWFTNKHSYLFNSDGTAKRTDQSNQDEVILNWELNDGLITLNGDLFILPLYLQGPGYEAIELLDQSNIGGVTRDSFRSTLFIPRENVNMEESDWVGRWNMLQGKFYVGTFDQYSNGVYRDGFEQQLTNTWSVVGPSRVQAITHNGVSHMEYELLAARDEHYYVKQCYGFGEINSNFSAGCSLGIFAIDKTFTGNTFWGIWSNPLFQESDTLKTWKFSFNILEQENSNSTSVSKSYTRVGSNLLYDTHNKTLLEMLSSDTDSVSVCEYSFGQSCDSGITYNLMRGLEVKITSTGHGSLMGARNEARIVMFPRLRSHQFELKPDRWNSVESISGCGGVLAENIYTIPSQNANCEITVKFTSL